MDRAERDRYERDRYDRERAERERYESERDRIERERYERGLDEAERERHRLDRERSERDRLTRDPAERGERPWTETGSEPPRRPDPIERVARTLEAQWRQEAAPRRDELPVRGDPTAARAATGLDGAEG